jgi:phage N-6-adenine-methyltransferase
MYRDLVDPKGEYETPYWLFNYLNTFWHFKLDPCASEDNNLNLPFTYTESHDGLTQPWLHNAFVNPPYGAANEIRWVKKSVEEHIRNKITVFLVLPAKTEASWFERAYRNAKAILFIDKRINFEKNKKQVSGNNIGTIIFGYITRKDMENNFEYFYLESLKLGGGFTGTDPRPVIFWPNRDKMKDKYGFQ